MPRLLLLLGVLELLATSPAMAQQASTPIPGPPPPRRVLSPAAKQQLEAMLPGVRTKVEALQKARSALNQAVAAFSPKELERKKLDEENVKFDQKVNAFYKDFMRRLAEEIERTKQAAAAGQPQPPPPEFKSPLSQEEQARWLRIQSRLRELEKQLEPLRKRMLAAQQRFQQAREAVLQP